MIKESGRVVAVEQNHIWLETIQRSTCGSCAGESTCGQNVLQRWMSRSRLLKVGLENNESAHIKVNDVVTIGVPENLVVVNSLVLYCLPVIGLITGAGIANATIGGDGASVVGAIVGLCAGGLLVRAFSWMRRNNPNNQPVLVD